MLQNDRCRKRGETTKKHHTNIDLHNYHWVVDEFDINSWDGSDFFNPSGTAITFCTEKIRDLFAMNKISNVELINIKEVEHYVV